jgi:hypothetical protein
MVDCQHRGYRTQGLSGEVVAADSGSSYRALKKLLRPGVARESDGMYWVNVSDVACSPSR